MKIGKIVPELIKVLDCPGILFLINKLNKTTIQIVAELENFLIGKYI